MSQIDLTKAAGSLLAQNEPVQAPGPAVLREVATESVVTESVVTDGDTSDGRATNSATPEAELTDPATSADPAALLASLRDIHLPEQSGSALPPGWVLVAVGALLLLAMLAVYFARKRRTPDWRQIAQQEMTVIKQQMPRAGATDTVTACSRLLRRVCMALAPRTEVAAMTGEPWLELLDSLHNSREFSEGPGRALADQPYRRPDNPDSSNNPVWHQQPAATQELVTLVENFVNHAGPLRS